MAVHPIGVLSSGGLDSCILVSELLSRGRTVQPIYIRSNLIWESAELSTLRQYLRHVSTERLRELVLLDLPLSDLYGRHWSVTGEQTPGCQSADESVYLPGRNALLVLKAALWCQLHGVSELALGPLATSPFQDARADFFDQLQSVLRFYTPRPASILLPFAALTKRQVMQRGRECPLELTFSCLSPAHGDHCGRCNKCEERRRAFRDIGLVDPTIYVAS